MNKMEYLSALKEALSDTEESIMREIVSDYEEHFQAGMENGKSEEEICEDLGSIEDLVKEIKDVYNTDPVGEEKDDSGDNDGEQTDSGNKKSKDWHFNIPNIDTEKIGDAINSALGSAGEAISKIDVIEIGHTLKSTIGQATSSINNFTDTYLKNHGSNPFDFGKRNAQGYTDNVSKSYDADDKEEDKGKSSVSYEAETVADTNEENVIEPEQSVSGEFQDTMESTKNQAEVSKNTGRREEEIEEPATPETEEEARETEEDTRGSANTEAGLNLIVDGVCAEVTVVKSSDDKINISYENNGSERQKQMYEFYSYKEGNTVYAGIRRVGKAVFLFNLNQNSININVELPEKMSNVELKTANGDIRIRNVKADRMVVATASGETDINEVYATDLRVKCSSGDIRIENINSIQLKASTMSGDVHAEQIEAKFLSLKSSSGDVKARNILADIIDNSSLSGDLKMQQIKTGECKLRSTSGDIDVDDITMNNADISSISGKIKLPGAIGDGLRVNSTSGNVVLNVNVKRCHASSKSGNVDVICEGDIVLESNSTSGNVDVTLKNYGNGYSIKSRTTSGELYINYNNMRQRNLRSGTYTFGNQGSELIISSISGDIHLTD